MPSNIEGEFHSVVLVMSSAFENRGVIKQKDEGVFMRVNECHLLNEEGMD